jgi:hypothetical protein
MSTEHTLTLRQADAARVDFALIEDHLGFIAGQLAKQPTRCDLAKTALGIIFARRSSRPCLFGSLGTRITCHERRGNHRAGDCGRLRRPAFGQRAPIPRGNTGIPTRASLSVSGAHKRRVSWLPQGSRLAARLRRPRRSFQYAMADRCRREGQGPLGTQGVRPLRVPLSAVGRPVAWCAEYSGIQG